MFCWLCVLWLIYSTSICVIVRVHTPLLVSICRPYVASFFISFSEINAMILFCSSWDLRRLIILARIAFTTFPVDKIHAFFVLFCFVKFKKIKPKHIVLMCTHYLNTYLIAFCLAWLCHIPLAKSNKSAPYDLLVYWYFSLYESA